MKQPKIDLSDDEFGTVLNCAVRYALGRQTYMPMLVMDQITPWIPFLSAKCLGCFDRDIDSAERENMLGSPSINATAWLDFRLKVNAEMRRRASNDS